MGMQKEINGLVRMMDLVEGESIQTAFCGTVHGPSEGLNTRDGILFTTQFRLGVSAIAGWFEGDACAWVDYSGIHDIEYSATSMVINTAQGTFRVEGRDGSERTHDMHVMHDYIVQCCNNVCRADLNDALEHGWTYYGKNKFDDALSYAMYILEHQPGCVPALLLAAHTLEALGETEQSLSCLKDALEYGAHDYCDIQALIADRYEALEHVKEAIESATEALSHGPHEEALRIRGSVRFDSGDREGGLRDIREAAKCFPDNASTWYLLGLYSYLSRDTRDFEQIEHNLTRLEAYEECRYVSVLHKRLRGKHEEAFELAKQLVETWHDNVIFARLYMELALEVDPATGAEMLPRFDDYAKDDILYQIWSSNILLETGRSRQAEDRFREALSHFDQEFQESTEVRAAELILKIATQREHGSITDLLPNIMHFVRDDSWVSHEDRDVYDTLCFYAGLILCSLGRFKEALPWLHKADTAHKLSPSRLADELPALIEQAHQQVSLSHFEMDDVTFTGPIPTYQLILQIESTLDRFRVLDELHSQAQELRASFDQPPLVAIMGEYSVGKSTFINALLGSRLLPTGEGVTTGTVVWLKHSEDERLRVLYRDGHTVEREGLQSIQDTVVESAEGRTAEEIKHVEVFLNAEILKRINIVDTPGLNAPFIEHKKTTEEFLEKSDAVLFLFNVEAAGKANEGDFLKKVREHSRKAVGIINQIDLVPPYDVEDVMEGVREDFSDTFVDIHGVSGKLGLDARLEQNSSKLERSNLPALENWLEEHMLLEARGIKAQSTRAKLSEIVKAAREKRVQMDETMASYEAQLVQEQEAFINWVHGELQDTINHAHQSLDRDVEACVNKISTEIASASSPQVLCRWSKVEVISLQLQNDFLEVSKTFGARLVESYDERVFTLMSILDAILGAHDSITLQQQVLTLKVNIQSWRKDLLDYLEQVTSYGAGFLEAQGLMMLLQQVPQGSYDHPGILNSSLNSGLGFMQLKSIDAAHRWTKELIDEVDEHLTQLKHSIRSEASRIRQEVYMPVEALLSLC